MMGSLNYRLAALTVGILFALANQSASAQSTAPSPTTFTMYGFSAPQSSPNNYNFIYWEACGPDCFLGGQPGPYGNICAAYATSDGFFYVADSDAIDNNAPTGTVMIYVYNQSIETDTNWGGFVESLTLPITPDKNAHCAIGATSNYLYFGMDQSPVYAINRSTYAVSTRMAGPVVSISTNDNFALITTADKKTGLPAFLATLNNENKLLSPVASGGMVNFLAGAFLPGDVTP